MEKLFYIIYIGDYDLLEDNETSPQELTDERFKAVATDQGNVYTASELCEYWNNDSLPVMDSYIRHI